MGKLTIYLDEDARAELRELARRKKTTMAGLVRHALDASFEDDLDLIAAERALEEATRNPNSTMSWEAYVMSREAGGAHRGS